VTRGRSIAALLAAGALLALAPGDAGAQPGLGYNEDLHALQAEGRLDSVLDDMEAQGAALQRLNVYACRTTTPQGWEGYDAVVEALADRDMRAVVMIGGVPGPACPDNWAPPEADREWDAWYGFVAETVRRTWRVADSYEVWNEPNLPTFWDADVDPAAYAMTVTYAELAIEQVEQELCAESGECDLEAPTAFTGLGRPDIECADRAPTAAVCPREYLRGALAFLSPAYVDAIGIHLYPEGSYEKSNRVAQDEALAQYDDLDRAVAGAGFGAASRLVTEVGFRTRTEPDRCGGVDEADQAARLTGTWLRLGKRPNLDAVQIHRFVDSRHEVCRGGPYKAFGVMGSDYGPDGYEPKRSYCALAAFLDRDPPKC
jgi:hypothetical protein